MGTILRPGVLYIENSPFGGHIKAPNLSRSASLFLSMGIRESGAEPSSRQ